MARVALTDKLVEALRPSGKRYDVLDSIVPGLLASVNPGGKHADAEDAHRCPNADPARNRAAWPRHR
jgi:hypothetical protein